MSTQEFTLSIPSFERHSGGQSGPLFVRCSLFGTLDKPVVAALGGISADHRVAGEGGWWSDVVNEQQYLNGKDVTVLGFEYITSKDGTTPDTQDQASVLAAIHEQLNIPPFWAVIGCSYGGMVAQSFAAHFPHLTEHLINLVAAHRNSIKSQTLRWIQRQVLSLSGANTHDALATARALAVLTYRGEQEFDERFASLGEASNYLKHQGGKFAQRFSPNRYLQLSASIDQHHIDPKSLHLPSLIIAIDSDQLVPAELVQTLADGIQAPVELHFISSAYGHDGFLKEAETIANHLAIYFSEHAHDTRRTNTSR